MKKKKEMEEQEKREMQRDDNVAWSRDESNRVIFNPEHRCYNILIRMEEIRRQAFFDSHQHLVLEDYLNNLN